MNDYQYNEIVKCRDSYEYFIKYYLKLNLRDYQSNFLCRVHNYRNNILLAPRRSGKDYTVLPYLLWGALFNSNKNIVIASNSYNNSKFLLQQITLLCDDFTIYETFGSDVLSIDYNLINFINGSKISIKISNKVYRGDDIDLLYLSEFSSLPKATDFWKENYPIISKRKTSKIVIASSPTSQTDEFYTQWKYALKGRGNFIPTKWDIEDTLVGDDFEKFKQETIANIGIDAWRTEFECEFSKKSKDTKGVNIENLTINGVPSGSFDTKLKSAVSKAIDDIILDMIHGIY